MKSVLPILAFMTIASLAGPSLACEQHQIHVALKVEAVPAPRPTVVIEPAALTSPASEIKPDDIMSQPLGAACEGCGPGAKEQDRLPYPIPDIGDFGGNLVKAGESL
jgi:hypothetical protein